MFLSLIDTSILITNDFFSSESKLSYFSFNINSNNSCQILQGDLTFFVKKYVIRSIFNLSLNETFYY